MATRHPTHTSGHVPCYKPCGRCGQPFRLKPSHYDKKTYCGVECMKTAYRERMVGSANPNFRDAGRHVCKHCAVEFKSYHPRTYCSRKCGRASPEFRAGLADRARKQWGGLPAEARQAKMAAIRRARTTTAVAVATTSARSATPTAGIATARGGASAATTGPLTTR